MSNRKPDSEPNFEQALARLKAVNAELATLLDEQMRLLAIIGRPDVFVAQTGLNEAQDRIAAFRADQTKPGIRITDVMKRTNASKRTIYRWLKDETLAFPQPTLVRGVSVWDGEAVDLWLARNIENLGRWPAKDEPK